MIIKLGNFNTRPLDFLERNADGKNQTVEFVSVGTIITLYFILML